MLNTDHNIGAVNDLDGGSQKLFLGGKLKVIQTSKTNRKLEGASFQRFRLQKPKFFVLMSLLGFDNMFIAQYSATFYDVLLFSIGEHL